MNGWVYMCIFCMFTYMCMHGWVCVHILSSSGQGGWDQLYSTLPYPTLPYPPLLYSTLRTLAWTRRAHTVHPSTEKKNEKDTVSLVSHVP